LSLGYHHMNENIRKNKVKQFREAIPLSVSQLARQAGISKYFLKNADAQISSCKRASGNFGDHTLFQTVILTDQTVAIFKGFFPLIIHTDKRI
jgi:hypothetical protein